MASVISKFFTIDATASGYEQTNILGGPAKRPSGYLRQVVIRQSSGAATTIDVEIRYESGDGNTENLVYKNTAAGLPLIDSEINAPFSLLTPGVSGGINYATIDDLQLYLEPDNAGTFEVRLDFEILNH